MSIAPITRRRSPQVILKKATVASQLGALAASGFDVVVNLCDGAPDEDRAGAEVFISPCDSVQCDVMRARAEVVDALERLRMPYTGADRGFYDPPRVDMKRVALAAGLATPAWAFAYRKDDVLPAVHRARLAFPMLVKHHNSYVVRSAYAFPVWGALRHVHFPYGSPMRHTEIARCDVLACRYSSIGLTRASKVSSEPELLARAAVMIETYHGCLIEEFVEGREFTVLVAEAADGGPPVTYTAVECTFPVRAHRRAAAGRVAHESLVHSLSVFAYSNAAYCSRQLICCV